MKKFPFLIFFALFLLITYSCIKAAGMPYGAHKTTGKLMQMDPADLDNSLVYSAADGEVSQ